jgi:hypothetical protein
VNLAALEALLNVARGRRIARWEPRRTATTPTVGAPEETAVPSDTVSVGLAERHDANAGNGTEWHAGDAVGSGVTSDR